MRRLATGVYDDGEGGLHIVEEELLAAAGWADTEENRRSLREAAILIADAQDIPIELD